jgi:hypothetical protein
MNHLARLVAVVALLAVAAFAFVRCRDDAESPSSTSTAPPASVTARPATPGVPPTDATQPAAQADDARARAMQDAVSTVHRYLTALGTGDPKQSDPFWTAGRPPPTRNEADLPTIEGLRTLRIENGTPRALDGQPVPEALEVPVTLRAGMREAPQRRYAGHYRLRRTIDSKRWEITSARIDRVPSGN